MVLPPTYFEKKGRQRNFLLMSGEKMLIENRIKYNETKQIVVKELISYIRD